MNSIIESIRIENPLYTISHILIVVFALGLGLLAYKRSPRNPNNRSFLALNLSLVLWILITYAANLVKIPIDIQIILNRLTFSAGFILVISLFNFCLVFPERNTAKPFIYRVVILICLVLAIFSAVADWLVVERVFSTVITFKPRFEIIFRLFFTTYALFSFWALFILHSKLRKLKGKKQTQVQYIFLAFLFFVIYIFATNLVPALFGWRFFIGHTALGAMIFTSLTSYAVIRHRLLDIRLVVVKSAVYTVLAFVGVSSYVFLIYYLKNFYEKIINPDLVFIAASFAVVFGFGPLGRLIQKQANKVFYKDRYNFEDLLKEIGHIVSTQFIIRDLAQGLLGILAQQMKVTKGAFVLSDGFVQENGLALPKKTLLSIYEMAQPDKALVADELEDGSAKQKLMRQADIDVLVFFFESDNRPLGFLALSEKLSGDAYTLQDLRLLEIIAPQITVAIKNIEQQQEIIEQIVNERHRIDQDAHDRIYNKLGSLAKKAELALLSPQQASETLGLLKDELRCAVGDLQKIVSGDTGMLNENYLLTDELEKICKNFQKQSTINLEYSFDNLPKEINPKNGWYLQCLLEECLNNAYKHSQATEIMVDVYANNGSIILEVKDNGIGISAVRRETLDVRSENSGMGLSGMKERAQKMNAKLAFSSNNGKGTSVKLVTPIA